jgi:predicted lipoprotein with Yx(FWY)xxD motif
LRAALALTAATVLVAGCGDEGGSEGAARTIDATVPSPTESAATKDVQEAFASKPARRKGAVVKVVGSQYGRVIADRKGEALYLFDKERGRKSECYGECAVAWPPVLAKGAPRAGEGAKQAKLGTTRRRDGKLQVTYAGHPLYYYVGDSPGTIRCHYVDEFGGLWLVVKPNGRPVS